MTQGSAAASAPAPAGGEKPKAYRRTYLVDRTFQLKYTFLMMVVGGGLALLFGFWMYDAHVQTTQILDMDAQLKQVAAAADKHLIYAFVGIAVLMVCALGLLGILMTHRVSGPIYVMSHYLAALAEGRYPQIRALRRRDELKAFFELFQRAVTVMKEREERDAAFMEEVAAKLAAAGKTPELQTAVDSLNAAAKRKRQAVG
jgi:nitrogen fixation/metabolism regulation signal transduction histidine kinase